MHEIALAPLLVLLHGVAPPTEPAALEVLQKVDAFYATSWSHLLVYSAVLFSVVGVLMPLIIQWAQARAARREEASIVGQVEALLRKKLDAEAADREERLKAELAKVETKLNEWVENARTQSAASVAEVKAEHRQLIEQTEGRLFHVQGVASLNAGEHRNAAESFASAATMLAKSNDLGNLNKSIQLLLSSMGKMTSVDLEQQPSVEVAFAMALEEIGQRNQRGLYDSQLTELKKTLQQAKQRKPVERATAR